MRAVELDSVEVGDAQHALDDLRAGKASVDVALAERSDDGVGVAQQRRVVDDCPAMGRDRSGHGAKTARRAAPPLALPDEVELVVLHCRDHTQGV